MIRLSLRAQNAILLVVALAALVLLGVLVYRHLHPPTPEDQALAALDAPFEREWSVYWLAQKDANSAVWHEALARCADTSVHRPNCTNVRVAQHLDDPPALPEPALASDLLRRIDQLAPLFPKSSPPVRP